MNLEILNSGKGEIRLQSISIQCKQQLTRPVIPEACYDLYILERGGAGDMQLLDQRCRTAVNSWQEPLDVQMQIGRNTSPACLKLILDRISDLRYVYANSQPLESFELRRLEQVLLRRVQQGEIQDVVAKIETRKKNSPRPNHLSVH